ncbi:hypothetical protein BkAM31D_07395 [Halalkalibacter krulwichiae]|uniref:Uncharacterized protein n=1 Tax=Halalkalibacter krulwichiae TaxID=199441 RepID=A0A1X9MAS6_9BACI|nr:hypothetical protein BkAM31D_07395 [Halalkalibacter krulwichiae]
MTFKKEILKFLLYIIIFTVSNFILKTILIPDDLSAFDIVSTIITAGIISIGIFWVEYSMKRKS